LDLPPAASAGEATSVASANAVMSFFIIRNSGFKRSPLTPRISTHVAVKMVRARR
jgi:hypothetical protein